MGELFLISDPYEFGPRPVSYLMFGRDVAAEIDQHQLQHFTSMRGFHIDLNFVYKVITIGLAGYQDLNYHS